MRIIFAGTPEFSVPALRALLESSHDVCAIYTQPDRPAGRGRKLHASPIKRVGEEYAVRVYQPRSLKTDEAVAILRSHESDLMVVAAYGLLLPPSVLRAPRLGCVNIHASLLPRWRGAAPIQRALLAGDAETGITIMQMDEGLDTGAVLHQVRCPIEPTDTAGVLHDRLATLGVRALLDTLPGLEDGSVRPVPQDDAQATYAQKLAKEEAALDWQESAAVLQRKVYAFDPWPVAQTMLAGGPLRIWRASVVPGASDRPPGTVLQTSKAGIDVATGGGILRITELQRSGKRRMHAAEFLNAHSLEGVRFPG